MILGNRSIGRYELSKYLGLSLAKTRSLLNTLVDNSLAFTKGKSSGKTGTILSKNGIQLYNSLNNIFNLNLNPQFLLAYTDLILTGTQPVVLSFKTSVKDISGLYERDLAVRNGALGAISLVKRKGNWVFPDGFDFENAIIQKISFNIEFNCCIIVFGESIAASSNGAIHIAEYHLYDSVIQVVKKFL
jgi:hypothetical protein